ARAAVALRAGDRGHQPADVAGGLMRWPWQRPAREPVAESATGRSEAPAPAAMGWAHLPPLQRSVASSATLVPGTASWTTLGHSPGLMGAIGHEVSADGPTGIIDGDGRGIGPDDDRRAEVAVPVVSRQVSPVS